MFFYFNIDEWDRERKRRILLLLVVCNNFQLIDICMTLAHMAYANLPQFGLFASLSLL